MRNISRVIRTIKLSFVSMQIFIDDKRAVIKVWEYGSPMAHTRLYR